jgi:heat-inducible transcriptional repressor
MALSERQEKLLDTIIKEHIRTAKAIGSSLLVEKHKFGLSPATIRNEMMALEKEGYLVQPHTSAGRVPSEKGYRFYIDNFLAEKELANQHKDLLKKSSKEVKEINLALKSMAKMMAQISDGAVVIGFEPQNVYYTGITNIFRQPEFSEIGLIYNLSEIVDHLDEALEDVFHEISQDVHILIGQDNPFGADCSAILTKYQHTKEGEGLFGILGPMRMDYNNNQALLKYTQELISNL